MHVRIQVGIGNRVLLDGIGDEIVWFTRSRNSPTHKKSNFKWEKRELIIVAFIIRVFIIIITIGGGKEERPKQEEEEEELMFYCAHTASKTAAN